MNDIFQNMLSAYDLSTGQAVRNATFEVNQQVILAGLYHGGFFDKAAFYGGTCLRIFHGLIIAKTKRAEIENEMSKTSLFSLPFFSCIYWGLNNN